MKTKLFALLALALLSAFNSPLSTAFAQNIIVTYQGRVTSNGTNFSGPGQFKFVLVTSTNHNHTATATANVSGGFVTTYNVTFGGNGYTTAPAVTISGGGGSGATAHASVSGGVVTSVTADSPGSGYTGTPTVTIAPPPDNITFTTFWSNDGTSGNGSEPAAAVSASVAGGLFTIPLGDTTLANMLALDAALFTQPNLQLRIWFNDGVNGFAVLSPVQDLTFAPYAANAANAAISQSASNLIGTLPSANIAGTYAGAVTFNNAGNSFAGSGAGLTSLNASQLTSGTVADARLSANVALRNANQTFTGVNTFNNAGNSFNGTFSGNGAGVTNLNLSLNSGGAIALSGGFLLSSSPGVGDGPFSVTAADVNGDGKVDLISANINANTLTVLTNNGNGGFVLSSSPGVGNAPGFVTAADVNEDGKVDLISANDTASGTLTVLTNNGSSGFVLSSSLGVGSEPTSVTAADVNGDAKVDLISANWGSSTLSVLTNNGSGGFVLSSSPGVGVHPRSVTTADVNGDGKVDLVSANQDANTLSVLTNNGSGGFVLASSPGVGANPYLVTAADVNGDAKVDLISANFTASTLSVLTNNGSGGFVFSSSPGVGVNPRSVTAADVNGDGKVDLISANATADTLTVLTNNGSGGFVLSSSPGVGDAPFSVTTADVNGDGKVDLISANRSANTLTVLFNVATFMGNFAGNFAGNLTGGLNWGGLNGRFAYSDEDAAGLFLEQVGNSTATSKIRLQVSKSGNFTDYAQFNLDPYNGFSFLGLGSGNGKVGIGRTAAVNALEVEGNASKTAAGSFLANSDARIKTDVRTVTGALDKLSQVRLVEFHYTDDYRAQHPSLKDRSYLNVVAQEFQNVFPEDVQSSGEKLPASGDPILQVDTYPLTIYSAAAIQELNQKVEAGSQNSEARVQKLEAENVELKKRLEKLERLMNGKRGVK